MAYKYKTDVARQRKKYEESYRKRTTPEVCRKRMFGEPCERCEAVAKLYASGDEEDKVLAGKCRARSTYYMNIVDLAAKDEGVKVYGCGIQNWQTLQDLLPGDADSIDDGGTDFTDPEGACAVILKRRGKGLGSKYGIKLSQKSFKIPGKWLKEMHQLDTIIDLIAEDDDLVWVPKEGVSKILVMPPWGKEAQGDFYYEVLYHWNVDALGISSGADSEEVDEGEEFEDSFDDDSVSGDGDQDGFDDIPY